MRRWLLFVLIVTAAFQGWSQNYVANFDFQDEDLRQVITFLEEEYKVTFSYADELIADKMVTAKAQNATLNQAIVLVFHPLYLQAEQTMGRNYVLVSIESRGEKPTETLTICGTLRDTTGEPLINGIVRASQTVGVLTDENGFFSLDVPKGETENIEFSYIGYEEKLVDLSKFSDGNCQDVSLAANAFSVSDPVVITYLGKGIYKDSETNAINIYPKNMTALAGLVEPDVFQTTQQLPGVSNPNGSASELYVRGGSPDQNLVLWNDIPLYETGHFFNMMSNVNPFFVEKVSVDKTNSQVAHSGRASSVLTIQSTDKPSKQFNFGSNFTHLHAFASLPLDENKTWGVQAGYRRSINDLIELTTFKNIADKVFQGTTLEEDNNFRQSENTTADTDFGFDEVNAAIIGNLNKTKLKASFFHSEDHLDYTNSFQDFDFFRSDILRTQNTGFSLSANRELKQGNFDFSAYSSTFINEGAFEAGNLESLEVRFLEASRNKVNDFAAKALYHHAFSNWAAANVGLQLQNQAVEYELDGENSGGDYEDITTVSAFGAYTFQVNQLHVNLGLRANHIGRLNDFIVNPKARIAYDLGNVEAYSFYSRNHQLISQISDFTSNTFGQNQYSWLLADEDEFPIQKSNQYGVGFTYRDGDGNWLIETEIYQKETTGLTSMAYPFREFATEDPLVGESTTKGIDFYAKKESKKLTSWLSYTLADVSYNLPDLEEDEFRAPYDIAHKLNLTNTYSSNGISASLAFNYLSGLPSTVIEEVRVVPNTNPTDYVFLFNNLNDSELAHSFSADFSIFYKKALRNDWGLELGLSATNIFDRDNPYNINPEVFTDENGNPLLYSTQQNKLGFTPNFSVRVRY